MSKVIYSAIRTPDGFLLQSRHRHDYRAHKDANGERYFLDGGCDYLRMSVNKEPAEVIQLTEEDPIEVIREFWNWGSYGPKGDQPLHYILLKDMKESHMHSIIDYCAPKWYNLFKREVEYRRNNDTN